MKIIVSLFVFTLLLVGAAYAQERIPYMTQGQIDAAQVGDEICARPDGCISGRDWDALHYRKRGSSTPWLEPRTTLFVGISPAFSISLEISTFGKQELALDFYSGVRYEDKRQLISGKIFYSPSDKGIYGRAYSYGAGGKYGYKLLTTEVGGNLLVEVRAGFTKLHFSDQEVDTLSKNLFIGGEWVGYFDEDMRFGVGASYKLPFESDRPKSYKSTSQGIFFENWVEWPNGMRFGVDYGQYHLTAANGKRLKYNIMGFDVSYNFEL